MRYLNLGIAAFALAALPQAAAAQSFWDGFDNNHFNPDLWVADSQNNGGGFGCTFSPDMIEPGQGGRIVLTLDNGLCSEIKSQSRYLYGTAQTRMRLSNVPGTVGSLFTYDSWYDTPGNPWTEIDIEYVPSLGNALHTNLIFQDGPSGTYRQWEKLIDLAPYGINPMTDFVQAGFDWTATQVAWYVMDSSGKKVYIRTIQKSSQTNCDCVPAFAWPKNPARIFANYWNGNNNNAGSVKYFPKRYDGSPGRAVYDWIQFIDY